MANPIPSPEQAFAEYLAKLLEQRPLTKEQLDAETKLITEGDHG